MEMDKQELVLKLIGMLVGDDSADEKTGAAPTIKVKGRYIVMGNRGNIVVGDLTIIGGTGYMKNASVIRRWGTKNGLGELALKGAQPNTVLDKCGEFEFETLATCGMIPVKSDI
jgi:hypothetical protein